MSLIQQSPEYADLSREEKKLLEETFLNGVFGIMLEDIILYETMQACKGYGQMALWDTYMPKYFSLPICSYKAAFPGTNSDPVAKEIDLIIRDKRERTLFHLLEIKT